MILTLKCHEFLQNNIFNAGDDIFRCLKLDTKATEPKQQASFLAEQPKIRVH